MNLNQTTGSIIAVIAIIIGSFFIAKLLKYLLGKYIAKKRNELENDSTSYNFLKHTINSIVFAAASISIFYTIPTLR